MELKNNNVFIYNKETDEIVDYGCVSKIDENEIVIFSEYNDGRLPKQEYLLKWFYYEINN